MSTVESLYISRSSEDAGLLPRYLIKKQGKLEVVGTYVAEGARLGPYDRVRDFGFSRVPLKGLVPENERLMENINGLTVLSFQNPAIRDAMDKLTDLANDNDNRSSNNSSDRKEYRDSLEIVYQAMAEQVLAFAGSGGLIFSPKNGGIFVQDVFEKQGLPFKNFFDYRMSRIQKADGGLMLGATFGKDNPKIKDYQQFIFADDCLASDVSAYATMEYIKEELEMNNISPSKAKVLITVSAATQRGVESVLSKKTRDEFGFGKIEVVAGILVYQMNDHYYLQHPDGRFVVGDMGNWTQAV